MVWIRHLCRICAQVGDSCYPIFEQSCGHNIELKMKKCFSFTVSKDDYKPKEICNCCYVKLNQFYDFIELCHASNNKFETMIYSSHQGIWLEKQTNSFEDCQMSGVIVNTKSTVESHLNVINVGEYENTLNLPQEINGRTCLSLAEPNYDVSQLGVGVNYASPTNISKQVVDKNGLGFKTYPQCYDHNQTVLRHSSDFYKSVENTGFSDLNYINMQLEQNVISYGEGVSGEQYDAVEVPKTKDLNELDGASVCDKGDDKVKAGDAANQTGKSVVKQSTKLFCCQHCNRMFMRKTNLNAHLALHTKIRPFSCDVCQKSFAIRRDLTCHQRLHTDMYRCKYCAKNFSVPSKLQRHLRTHTNIKPFVCSVDGCGKSFADKCNLEGHKASHLEAREFACDVCHKAYKTNSQLKDHKKVHSSEAPFKCGTCSKTYKWKTNLTIHMKKHDGYKCCKCNKDCEKLSALFKHRKVCKLNPT